MSHGTWSKHKSRVNGLAAHSIDLLTTGTYQQANGTAPPSLTKTVIEQNPNPTPDEEDVQRMTTSHLQAGMLVLFPPVPITFNQSLITAAWETVRFILAFCSK